MSIEGKFLNLENIIRKVFDHTTDSLKVNTSAIPTSVIIDSLDDSIAIGDSITGDKLTVRPDGTIVVGLDATSLAALENIDVTIENVDLDIRNLTFATDKVDVSNSTIALDATTLAALENININNFPSNQDVTITNVSLPVTGDWLTDTELRASAVAVSASALPLPTGAATSSLQTTGNASLSSIDSKLTSPLAVTGPLTDAELRASPVPISGTITATISGVSTLAEQQLQTAQLSAINADLDVALSTRASESTLSSLNSKVTTVDTTDVSITSSVLPSGAATSALQTSGNASLTSIDSKLTSPLTVQATDLDIRDLAFSTDKVDISGSDVTVSGSVAVTGPLTDTELRASPVPVSGTVTATISGVSTLAEQQLQTTQLNAINADLDVALSTRASEATLSTLNTKVVAVDTGAVVISSSALPTGASTSALQTSGNASLTSIDSKLTSPLTVQATDLDIRDLAFATDSVDVSGSSVSVSNFPATQPISAASLPLPSGAATSANQVTAQASLTSIDSKLTSPLTVTGPLTDVELRASPVPISGTVTTNLGTISGVATEVTLSALNTKVTAVDTGAVTISTALPTGTNSIGQVTANAGTNLNTSALNLEATQSAINSKIPANLTVTAARLLTDGSGVTQPISAVSLPLPTGAATLAEQLIQSTELIDINSKLNTLGQNTMVNSMPVTMASDQTKIPFYATDTVEETYSLLALGVAFANNKSMVSLLNSSSKVLRIKSVKMINNQTTPVTGVVVDLRFKRITGFTGGTALTPQTFDLNDTLASVTAATGATVSGESAADLLKYNWSTDEWGTGTLDVEAQDHTNQSIRPIYETRAGLKSITLRNGDGLTIKNITNTAVSTFDFEIIFTLGVV